MFQHSWPHKSSDRPAYFKPITHQTLIGKALFEHTRHCSTIAAVAGVSPNFRNSSLGPNLLALVQLNQNNKVLFLKVFYPDSTSTLQFTNAISANSSFAELLAQNLCQTKYFGVNDLKLELANPPLSALGILFEKCKRIVSLAVAYFSLPQGTARMFDSFDGSSLKKLSLISNVADASTVFKILYERSPNLEELSIGSSVDFASDIFSIISFQELQNNTTNNKATSAMQTHHPHLISLSINFDLYHGTLDHNAFQNIFCGGLLQRDQLRHLSLDFSRRLNEDDWNAFNRLTFNNLIMNESPWGILPCQCIGNPNFDNLKVAEVVDFSDADLVRLGNQCLLLEKLTIGFYGDVDRVGAFLSDPSLAPEAFNQVRSFFVADCNSFAADSMGDGFSRFKSLEKLILVYPRKADVVAAFFRHLPNPHFLKRLDISAPFPDAIANDFFSAHASKFSNLEVFILNCNSYYSEKPKITDEELLNLASLKNLKEIKLQFEHSDNGRCFSSSSIVRLVEQLPSLNRLEVERCCNFTQDSVKNLVTHRSLQDVRIGPVLMLKSKTRNKHQYELSTLAHQESAELTEFVRKEHLHIIDFSCWVSFLKFEDDEKEDFTYGGDGRRRQRNEDVDDLCCRINKN